MTHTERTRAVYDTASAIVKRGAFGFKQSGGHYLGKTRSLIIVMTDKTGALRVGHRYDGSLFFRGDDAGYTFCGTGRTWVLELSDESKRKP